MEDHREVLAITLLAITTRCYLSIPPESNRKPLGFRMFSRGIDKQHRATMG